MSKLQSLDAFSQEVSKEYVWRIKELANMKSMHDKSKESQQLMLRRAGIAMLYAHWEGFVKKAGITYVEHVARKKERLKSLNYGFKVLALKTKLTDFNESQTASRLLELVRFITDEGDQKAKISWNSAVNTKSNLNYDVFRGIADLLGLDYAPFEAKRHIAIDWVTESRHIIAHGHFLDIDADRYNQAHVDITDLLYIFKEQLLDAAAGKSHLLNTGSSYRF